MEGKLIRNKTLFVLIPIFLVILVTSCGKRHDSPGALLRQAKTYITEAKYTDAVTSLRDLIERYPDDPAAAEAQYMLGDTFMAYAKDFEQAVKEYGMVVSTYPESRFAMNAQFMLGYVCANFISDSAKAKQEYEKFLKLYSDQADSGLVQSVRFELENLGKDLNEIPKLQHITS